ncbi:putative killer suppression protein HigA [Richelia sinica FACHB-800]|uniref:Killer suppression protein HigA n=1 Tax=Richelia sinica FACHB-800 TaxID=1357546 RepID=A0A975TD37_9NOST|nr:killer suppression protein HigA [Richelia sinica]MBD2663826.1 killer suppression protein HigA [Richelia sinica FACHB-800]QXE26467.1 putative killer suppression protein HigA [Richelia sinica FACHB-800]
MEITFANSKLQDLCEQPKLAQRKLGAKCAKKLQTQLTFISVVSCVTELEIGHPHPLKGDRAGEFAVNLEGGKRLVFKPDNDPIPLTEDGSIDWSKVIAVCIVFIGDYHD